MAGLSHHQQLFRIYAQQMAQTGRVTHRIGQGVFPQHIEKSIHRLAQDTLDAAAPRQQGEIVNVL